MGSGRSVFRLSCGTRGGGGGGSGDGIEYVGVCPSGATLKAASGGFGSVVVVLVVNQARR